MRRPRFGLHIAGLLTVAIACGNCGSARADSKRFGDYEVIYSVVDTNFLRPDIAAAYGITRAAHRGLLNVALRRRAEGGTVPVAARISGEHGDLIVKSSLQFREVRESAAIYYLVEFPFKSGETRYFQIGLTPDGDTATLSLQFNKTLYDED